MDFTYAVVGGIIGGMGGLISFLVKALLSTKDDRIRDLVDERDYYRDAAISSSESQLPNFEEWYIRRHPPQHG